MVNEYTLSTLRCFFLFPCCVMAPETSAYFLPGAFEKNAASFLTAELHTEAFRADLRLLGSSPGIRILGSEQKGRTLV